MNRNSKTSDSRPKRRGFLLATAVASAAIAGGIIIPASSAMAAPATSVASVVAGHDDHGNHHKNKNKNKNQNRPGNTQGGTQGGGTGNTQGGTQGGGTGNTQGGTQGGGTGNTQGGTQGG
ncbi:hypothetical protein, partial [Streptomyces sp. NPDC001530]|uniref:hypothetical protein n=1 Tax=Streptomyces sp. NPDC001530 TaxID=3364582 RepID=UPI003694CC6F